MPGKFLYCSAISVSFPGPVRWITCKSFMAGSSCGIIKLQLIFCAPREPPKISNVGLSGEKSESNKVFNFAMASGFGSIPSSTRACRKGSPVNSQGQCKVLLLAAGKDSANFRAIRLNVRFALPTRALPSCRKMGRCKLHAPRAAGREMELPMISMASGLNSLISFLEKRKPSHTALRNLSICSGFLPGR